MCPNLKQSALTPALFVRRPLYDAIFTPKIKRGVAWCPELADSITRNIWCAPATLLNYCPVGMRGIVRVLVRLRGGSFVGCMGARGNIREKCLVGEN